VRKPFAPNSPSTFYQFDCVAPQVLWPGAKWTPLTLGDLVDDKAVKRAYKKASLLVHPDRTSRLSPGQRFAAKRIFDALTQAVGELK
jgi:hypothetical protein